jgi:hypothetical protein
MRSLPWSRRASLHPKPPEGGGRAIGIATGEETAIDEDWSWMVSWSRHAQTALICLVQPRYFKTLLWAITEVESFAGGRVISRACTLAMTEVALDKPVGSQRSDSTGYRYRGTSSESERRCECATGTMNS